MIKVSTILLMVVLFYSSQSYTQDVKENVDFFIKENIGDEISYEFTKYNLSKPFVDIIEKKAKQKFLNNFVYLYQLKSDNKLVALGLLDNVKGKAMPISFIVLFDLTGKVISSGIIKYREQYGGAVSNKEWNNQFKEKNSESGFTVGKDVSTISGATISVNSVTKGIHKLTLLINYIIKNNEY